jgi:hypothetical protein
MQAIAPRIEGEPDVALGLSSAAAAERLATVGPNALPERPPSRSGGDSRGSSPGLWLRLFVFAGALLAWALAETVPRLVWHREGTSRTNR